MSHAVSRISPGVARIQALWPWIAAIAIATAAAALYVAIADWPAGTHPDELKKARFILSGEQDFHHPVLPLQISRLANFFLGYSDIADTLSLGRTFSGVFGGLVVFATFVLRRLVLAPGTAVAAAAAVSVTPLVAIHATFLKEDIYLAAAAIFGLAGLLSIVDRPTKKMATAVGFAFGVAISAKLVGALFLAYAIVVALVACRASWSARAAISAIVLVAAILTFVAINAWALLDYETVLAALDREGNKAAAGTGIVLPIWVTGGIAHLRDNLAPGLGLPLVALGLAGLSAPILNTESRKRLTIIAGAALLWYLAHELSPLKAVRYMVPEAPLFVVLGASFVETIVRKGSARWAPAVASAVLLLAAVPIAYNSYRIVKTNAHDPRRVMEELVGSLGRQALVDKYVLYDTERNQNWEINLRRDRTRPLEIFVTSSFTYGPYDRYGNDLSQSSEIRRRHEFYFDVAFNHPYLELSSGGPEYRYLNPVIRIVAMDRDIDRLFEIGQAVIEIDPHIQLGMGP